MAQTKKPKRKRQPLTQAQLCALHPVGRAQSLQFLRDDIASLRNTVALQVEWGDNPTEIVRKVGKLFFIIDRAARAQGIPATTPELRILESTCNALIEIGERQTPETLERHRTSIAASLDAADRIMERLSVYALGIGLIEYEECMRNMARAA